MQNNQSSTLNREIILYINNINWKSFYLRIFKSEHNISFLIFLSTKYIQMLIDDSAFTYPFDRKCLISHEYVVFFHQSCDRRSGSIIRVNNTKLPTGVESVLHNEWHRATKEGEFNAFVLHTTWFVELHPLCNRTPC